MQFFPCSGRRACPSGPVQHTLRLVRDGTAAALKVDGGQLAEHGNPK